MDELNEELYACLLGKVVANFHGLEFAIRAFLYERKAPVHFPFTQGFNVNQFVVGDVVPENAMTCYDGLRKLIGRYNSIAPNEFRVDERIVDIRDAIAHGRVSGFGAADNFHLLKFSEAANGKVQVTFSQEMNASWLREKIKKVRSELQKVVSNSEIKGKQ